MQSHSPSWEYLLEQTELHGHIENLFVYVTGSQETDIYGAFF